jgi:hypothetical protein
MRTGERDRYDIANAARAIMVNYPDRHEKMQWNWRHEQANRRHRVNINQDGPGSAVAR